MKTDNNGLELSETSGSGYRLVTIYEGNFVAYASIKDERLKKMKKEFGNVVDFFGFDNVVALGEFDDVRDAAYVAQTFQGSSEQERDENLELLFNGDYSVIPEPPYQWDYSRAENYVQKAIERRKKAAKKRKTIKVRKKLTVQEVMGQFFKDHYNEINATKDDAPNIREKINQYLSQFSKRPTNDDILNAAEYAFRDYMVV